MALRTPLYDAHLKSSARMVEFAGFDMPVQYKGVLEEHAAVRESAGMFDVSHMGEVVLEGANALGTAQRLVTNDLSRCSDGQAQYSALCNEKGGVIDDIIVYRFSPERLFICVNASGRSKDYEWMRAHAGSGVAVSQRSDDWAQIAVQGPRAPEIVDSLCDPRVLDRARPDEELPAAREDHDRLTRALHDDVVQTLFGIGMELLAAAQRVREDEVASRLEEAASYLDSIIGRVRAHDGDPAREPPR